MWSYLTRSFINPLTGYVEDKAGDAENGLRSAKSPFCSFTVPALGDASEASLRIAAPTRLR